MRLEDVGEKSRPPRRQLGRQRTVDRSRAMSLLAESSEKSEESERSGRTV